MDMIAVIRNRLWVERMPFSLIKIKSIGLFAELSSIENKLVDPELRDALIVRDPGEKSTMPLQTKGVAIVVTSRFAIFKHAWTDAADDARIQVPPTGFKRVKTTRFYAAYVRC